MKKSLFFVMMLLLVVFANAQEMKYANSHPQLTPILDQTTATLAHTRAIPQYSFATEPFSLLQSSYWDYMIGGYNGLPVRIQQSDSLSGTCIVYMGQRTSNGLRRVFYAYLDENNSLMFNNEIGNNQIREGYVTTDCDPLSGKPFMAWHSNADATDTQLENLISFDSFLSGIPGLFAEPVINVNNPTTIADNNTFDNDFDWPVTLIGPSPLTDHRRVYVFTTNSVTHCNPANPSENVLIAYADFTPEQMETGANDFTWQYTTIPTLDRWNADQTAWRRFFQTPIVGDDGSIYLAGYRTGQLSDATSIDDSLTIFVNNNYGEGSWEMYSMYPNFEYASPDTTGSVYCRISTAGHMSGCVKNDNTISFPIVVSWYTPDNRWYPLYQPLQEVVFSPIDNSFVLHDLYPTGIYPNNGVPVAPWDMDEDGVEDSTSFMSWPYVFWDDGAVDGAMMFHYGGLRMTKMNSQGMMAMVWSSSLRSKLYNEYPAIYPELAPFAGVPEIFISVYPIDGLDGHHWSEPISLNSVETPQLNEMIPEWPYPGDYVKYLGVNEQGNKVGELKLMFFDDNSWGAASINPPQGQANGGNVVFTSLKIAWGEGSTTDNHDPITPMQKSVLNQNYPNPFNPETTINFKLSDHGNVKLNIYNVKGQLIKTLANENKASGDYSIKWDGKDNNGKKVASGIYLYKIKSGNFSSTKKMILLK